MRRSSPYVAAACWERDGDRVVGVLAELGAGDHRRPLVEQADQRAQQPGLALAALAEQHDVVAGEQRALDLRDDGLGEAVQARPRVLAGAQLGEQVVAQLLAERPELVAARAELAEGAGCGVLGLLLGHALHARPVRQRRVRSKSGEMTVRRASDRAGWPHGLRCWLLMFVVLIGVAFWAGRLSVGRREHPPVAAARSRRASSPSGTPSSSSCASSPGSTATSPPSSRRSSSTRSPPTTAASPAAREA